jgi:hypothetical protein
MQSSINQNESILDIGTPNPFSDRLQNQGLTVYNTTGLDLDESPESVRKYDADITTAFEIFEHLLNPLGVLKAIKSERSICQHSFIALVCKSLSK